jgi:hypothetical protein
MSARCPCLRDRASRHITSTDCRCPRKRVEVLTLGNDNNNSTMGVRMDQSPVFTELTPAYRHRLRVAERCRLLTTRVVAVNTARK